jgi:hypothetical protein
VAVAGFYFSRPLADNGRHLADGRYFGMKIAL